MITDKRFTEADDNGITYGNSTDACVMCAKKIADEKKEGLRFALRELRGKYEGQKMFLVPNLSERVVVCSECVKKAAKTL